MREQDIAGWAFVTLVLAVYLTGIVVAILSLT